MVGSTNVIDTIHNGVHNSTDSIKTSKTDIRCVPNTDKNDVLNIDNQVIDLS